MSDLPKFDELVKLAQENPEKLEALRQQHINALIEGADESHQQRLRGLQFQIDSQRQIHRDSPMGSCMKISKMMHESFAELRGHLNQMTNANDPLRDLAEPSDIRTANNRISASASNKAANVLAFPSS